MDLDATRYIAKLIFLVIDTIIMHEYLFMKSIESLFSMYIVPGMIWTIVEKNVCGLIASKLDHFLSYYLLFT